MGDRGVVLGTAVAAAVLEPAFEGDAVADGLTGLTGTALTA
jgi:hypothetical protein